MCNVGQNIVAFGLFFSASYGVSRGVNVASDGSSLCVGVGSSQSVVECALGSAVSRNVVCSWLSSSER